jgi:hypothetical protein
MPKVLLNDLVGNNLHPPGPHTHPDTDLSSLTTLDGRYYQQGEVSTDGGANWVEAEVVEGAGPLSWVRFEASWDAQPGQVSLYARATDELQMTQPWSVPWNEKCYYYNAIFEVPVTVG